MIFDCHCYMGKQNAWSLMGLPVPFTGKDMVKYMTDAGVDKVLVAPPGSGQSDFFNSDHEIIAQAVKDYPGKIFGYVRVNPTRGQKAIDELVYWVKKRGLHAVKFNTGDCPNYTINDRKIMGPVLEAIQELDIPVLVHTGEAWGITCSPALLADIAMDFPNVKWILGHMGIPGFWQETIPFCKRVPQLMVETAGVYRPYLIQELVNAIGAERVMIGSNAPYIPLECGIITVRQYCRLLKEREKDLILGGNISRLLGLKS